jgi:aspartate ammonia-lyase
MFPAVNGYFFIQRESAPQLPIAKEALATGGSVYQFVLQKGWRTQERLDDILRPENMTAPRQLPT